MPADAPTSERADPSLPREGYALTISIASGVELRHADDNGLRYGRAVLRQLTGGDGIAEVEIRDHPDIAVRGHMLDISRDRVPTRETLELLVQRLAVCRYNHLQLYTEHTFAYTGHDAVWQHASPLTADDMRWLDGICRAHGIELTANQNTFGHMERWLRHDAYRSRAETPDGFDHRGMHRPPTALEPTAGNADFALGLVRELLGCVSSRRVNIGCDEVWELGKGRSAERVAERGKAAVFVEQLRRLADPLLADGYEVQFWADMVDREPELGRELAEAGAIATVWGYEAPDPDADTPYQRGFAQRLASFADSGFRLWVAPGTSGWNSFVGRHRNARANIADAVEGALTYGAEGILVTEWGDNGHIQPPFATLPALAYGGASSWCHATNGDVTDDALARAVSRHLLDDATGSLGQCLVELASVNDALRVQTFNGAAFFYTWIDTRYPLEIGRPEAAALANAHAQLDRAEALLGTARPGAGDADALLAETRFSARLVRHGIECLVGQGDPNELAGLKEEHRARWLARSQPGGLIDSLARLS